MLVASKCRKSQKDWINLWTERFSYCDTKKQTGKKWIHHDSIIINFHFTFYFYNFQSAGSENFKKKNSSNCSINPGLNLSSFYDGMPENQTSFMSNFEKYSSNQISCQFLIQGQGFSNPVWIVLSNWIFWHSLIWRIFFGSNSLN